VNPPDAWLAKPPMALIGAPLELGAGRRGCAMGPAALRTAGLAEGLEDLGYSLTDLGDLKPSALAGSDAPSGMAHHWREIAAWTREISDRVRQALNEGLLPIVLGGDHALAMGSINGVAAHCEANDRELFVLWLDAHADFNTPQTSPSGNMHGMPLAMLCRERGLEGLIDEAQRVSVNPGNVHLFGIRSVDRGERALLAERGVQIADMRLIDEFGVVAPLKAILAKVGAARGHLHVSLDVDFLDPSLAPGVGTQVPGGATYREAHLIMEMLHDSGLVGSLDLVELNPMLDERGRSAAMLVDLTCSLFGRSIVERKRDGR
jgi:arginase